MGEPMPLASHAVAAPADAAVSPTVWLLPGITVPAAKKNGYPDFSVGRPH